MMDWTDLLVKLAEGLRVPLVVLIVLGAKKVFARLPRVALPILAAAFGVAADWIGAQLGMGTFSALEGALWGAAATWLRELVNTAREHGTSA